MAEIAFPKGQPVGDLREMGSDFRYGKVIGVRGDLRVVEFDDGDRKPVHISHLVQTTPGYQDITD
jgi:hypothetical protein